MLKTHVSTYSVMSVADVCVYFPVVLPMFPEAAPYGENPTHACLWEQQQQQQGEGLKEGFKPCFTVKP